MANKKIVIRELCFLTAPLKIPKYAKGIHVKAKFIKSNIDEFILNTYNDNIGITKGWVIKEVNKHTPIDLNKHYFIRLENGNLPSMFYFELDEKYRESFEGEIYISYIFLKT